MNTPNLPNLLTRRRKERKLTQKELAAKAGIKHSSYAAYEEGRATPSIYKIIALARELGFTSVDQFLELA